MPMTAADTIWSMGIWMTNSRRNAAALAMIAISMDADTTQGSNLTRRSVSTDDDTRNGACIIRTGCAPGR